MLVVMLVMLLIHRQTLLLRAQAHERWEERFPWPPFPWPPPPPHMGIDGPERVSHDIPLWKVTYTDPPREYVKALQLCKDESAPCSFLITSMSDGNGGRVPPRSYRIVEMERFPAGGDDMVRVFFVEDVRDAA